MIDLKKVELELANISTTDKRNKHFLLKSKCENEDRSYKQARRHNMWLKELDIIAKKFPMEPKPITDYRNENKRQFTKEVPRKINQEVVNILTHLQIEVKSDNELFKAWLLSKPFKIGAARFDLKTWSTFYFIYKYLMDANAILVPFPIFVAKEKPFDIETRIIPYNKRYIDPKGEYIAIMEDGTFKTFLVADKEKWYRVTLAQGNTWEELTEHRLQELPYVMVPGLTSEDEETGEYYQESLISSTYEYCDEALVAFSTDQAVRISMTPKLFKPVTACMTCQGTGKVKEEKTDFEIECKACKGDGIGAVPGDYADWVYKPTDMTTADGKVPPPMYISPDVTLGDFHSKTVDKYMAHAKRTCGIDSLIDQQESGEAMKHRLATLESFIQYLISLQYQFVLKKYLELVFKLLEWDRPEQWENLPTIITPKRVEIKTPEILKMNFQTAIGIIEKIQAGLEYFKNIYQDDPVLERASRLTIENYPSSLFESKDLSDLKLNNSLTETEIARGMRAFLVIKKLLSDPLNFAKEDPKIMELANAELEILVPSKINTAEIPE